MGVSIQSVDAGFRASTLNAASTLFPVGRLPVGNDSDRFDQRAADRKQHQKLAAVGAGLIGDSIGKSIKSTGNEGRFTKQFMRCAESWFRALLHIDGHQSEVGDEVQFLSISAPPSVIAATHG